MNHDILAMGTSAEWRRKKNDGFATGYRWAKARNRLSILPLNFAAPREFR
jgi:hypothetical protein